MASSLLVNAGGILWLSRWQTRALPSTTARRARTGNAPQESKPRFDRRTVGSSAKFSQPETVQDIPQGEDREIRGAPERRKVRAVSSVLSSDRQRGRDDEVLAGEPQLK